MPEQFADQHHAHSTVATAKTRLAITEPVQLGHVASTADCAITQYLTDAVAHQTTEETTAKANRCDSNARLRALPQLLISFAKQRC